jgi:hypothetical protein
VSSLPSVNLESRLGRVWIRRLGGEAGEVVVEGVGRDILGCCVVG